MSEIPEVFAIFEQKLAHVLSFNLRQKGQKKAIVELLVYFSGIVERASKAESRIAELERDKEALSGIKEILREHIEVGTVQLSTATARIAKLEKDNAEFRQLIRDWSIVLDQNNEFQLWQVESVRQAMLEINKECEK